MFQLIVAVIAISLMVVLVLASIFYGGEAYTKAREKARAQATSDPAVVSTETPSSEQTPVYRDRTVFDNFRIGWGTSDAF
jgi:hypothetical protein|nr:hypothetical protein [Neorhizobium tomejilense]